MNKRIENLKESPCNKCTENKKCLEKIRRSPILSQIRDSVFSIANYDYLNCSIYKSFVAPIMIDES